MRSREVKRNEETLWRKDAAGLMERGGVSFGAEVLCHVLADAMNREGVGGVSIVDPDNKLIGIVTEFDLINALLAGMDLKKTPAEEVMSEPICITEGMAAEEIMTLFQSGHLIRLPVVDAEGRLVGVVRRKNILSSYLQSVPGTIQDADGGDE